MTNPIIKFAICFCLFLNLAFTQPTGWSGYVSIELSTEVGRADINTDIVAFPTLIRLGSADFDFSLTKGNGDDIRFTDSNDVLLPYEIEMWDSANSSAVIWVLVDTLKANSKKNIKMFYGNSSASAASNSGAVFDTTNGFAGVWHLAEDGNITASGYKDATLNTFDGTGTSMGDTTDVSAMIGMGQDFDGTGGSISLDNITSDFSGGITVCGWMNFDAYNNYSRMIDCGTGPSADNFLIANTGTTSSIGWNHYNGGSYTGFITTNYWELDTWIYSCGTWDGGTNMYVYKNGNEFASKTTGVLGLANVTRTSCNLAQSNWVGNDLFDGTMDEVQISTSQRSADWIKLSYENQQSSQTLVRILGTFPDTSGCTNAFGVSKSTVNLSENDSDTLVGTSTCALQASEWLNQDSTQIQTGDQYIITSGRIIADTSFDVIFKAVFDTGVSYQNVTVNITNNIPDPIPSITAPPGSWDGTSSLGITSTLTNAAAIAASSEPNVTYLWSKVGTYNVTLTNANTNSVILSSPGEYGTLKLELCADNGGTTLCDTVDVVIVNPVDPAPVIDTQPSDTTVIVGQTASFTIASVSINTTTLWQKDALGNGAWVDISGATSNTLAIGVTTVADSGSKYRALLTNTGGTDTSTAAMLSVLPALDPVPIIDSEPTDTTVVFGQSASFTFTSASINTSSQWQKDLLGNGNWVDISGATNNTLAIGAVTMVDGGSQYRVILTSSGGSDTSRAAILTVQRINPIPIITPPTDTMNGTRTLIILSSLQNAAEIANSPDSIVTYLWSKIDSFPVTFQNESTSSLSLLWPLNDGTYNVELCVNNGGPMICDTTQVVIKLLVGVGERIKHSETLFINNGSLIWNKPARIKIWSMDGKVLFDRSGKTGDTYKLSGFVQREFQKKNIILEIKEL